MRFDEEILFLLGSSYSSLLDTLASCQFTTSVSGSDASLVRTSKNKMFFLHRRKDRILS